MKIIHFLEHLLSSVEIQRQLLTEDFGSLAQMKEKTSNSFTRALHGLYKELIVNLIHKRLIDLPGSGIVQALHLKCSLGSEG